MFFDGVADKLVVTSPDGSGALSVFDDRVTLSSKLVASNGGIEFSDGTVQTSAGTGLWVESGSDIYYDGGNVGIGTNNPAKELHVSSSDSASAVRVQTLGQNWDVELVDGSPSVFRLVENVGGSVPFQIENGAATNSLYIDSSGRVGIGTPGPSYNLQVSGSAFANRLRADSINLDGDEIRFYRSTDSIIRKTNGYLELHGSANGNSRIWLQDNTDRIYIGDGNTDLRFRGSISEVDSLTFSDGSTMNSAGGSRWQWQRLAYFDASSSGEVAVNVPSECKTDGSTACRLYLTPSSDMFADSEFAGDRYTLGVVDYMQLSGSSLGPNNRVYTEGWGTRNYQGYVTESPTRIRIMDNGDGTKDTILGYRTGTNYADCYLYDDDSGVETSASQWTFYKSRDRSPPCSVWMRTS